MSKHTHTHVTHYASKQAAFDEIRFYGHVCGLPRKCREVCSSLFPVHSVRVPSLRKIIHHVRYFRSIHCSKCSQEHRLSFHSISGPSLQCVLFHVSPPAIFSAKRVTSCVKLTGPGASESMLDASPPDTDLPTFAKAFSRSEALMMPSLSVSIMPNASLNS